MLAAGGRARLAGVDVDADGDEEDGDEREVEDGVDEDGEAAGVHAAELRHPPAPRQRAQQPRRQQHEQHRRDDHRAPVRHLPSPLSDLFCLKTPNLERASGIFSGNSPGCVCAVRRRRGRSRINVCLSSFARRVGGV
uniref:Uncharacterized protein n=1 Tax=Triticum urartu TaxID=4572 RepID=A0A8R7PFG3_TRIUA